MINTAAFLIGAPQHFKDKCLVYPPKVVDVAADPHFWQYTKLLTLTQEEIEDEFLDKIDTEKIPTPFELLLINSYHSKEYAALVKKAFQLFIHSDIDFLFDRKLIVIGNLTEQICSIKSIEDLVYISEDEFFDFQNVVRQSVGDKVVEPPDPNEDPRVKKIKAKARYRDRIKAKKGMGLKLESCIASICCMGIGITPLNIGEMSYASVNTLIRTYQEKEKYEIDIRSLQAGADSKKIKPKYWIRNLTD